MVHASCALRVPAFQAVHESRLHDPEIANTVWKKLMNTFLLRNQAQKCVYVGR